MKLIFDHESIAAFIVIGLAVGVIIWLKHKATEEKKRRNYQGDFLRNE